MPEDDNTKKVQVLIQSIMDQTQDGEYIFRGEQKKYSKISSTLYRQYKKLAETFKEHFDIKVVEKDVIEKAEKHFPPDTSKIEMLADIQHNGGKTTLIDFSRSMCIALFFACNGSFEKNGRMLILGTDNLYSAKDIYDEEQSKTTKNKPLLLESHSKNNRVIF